LIPEGNTFGPYIHKRASFAYENEVRGIIQLSSAGPVGLSPQVDLEILMESVYVAPASPDWVVKVIESVMRRFGMDRHLQHSSLADGPLY
jgi:hypothetical protein